MRLADIFCDHMVLQRDMPICVYGTGTGTGSISFCGETVNFTITKEVFRVILSPQPAGGPYDMTVTLNGETTVITDILMGDVYIAAGQSNMEFCMNRALDMEGEDLPKVRFFKEPHNINDEGVISCDASISWQLCTPETAAGFTAIGGQFGMDMYHHTGVPVGILSCSKGASCIESWTDPKVTEAEAYRQWMAVPHYDYDRYGGNHDNWLFLNKLLNLIPYGVSGALWYQGESDRNPETAQNYDKLLEAMIGSWRKLWGYNIPFYLVQLMPYNEGVNADWATIRAMQEKVARTVDNVYLTTLVDTNETRDIHPPRKRVAAGALANAVKRVQFGADVEYCGPVLAEHTVDGNTATLTFCHADGLCIKGDALTDTFVLDADGTEHPVTAILEDKTLTLTWDAATAPVAIAMGWRNSPAHNLYNAADYLASPFKIEL